MRKPLDGTVALVTGSSSGIGAATARRLAADGAAVALVARRRDLLDHLASAIRHEGGRALAIRADVTDQAQARDAVEGAASELGRLDILVNNAGVMLLGPALDAPIEDWDRMVALNVQARCMSPMPLSNTLFAPLRIRRARSLTSSISVQPR